ncbi:MAG TPA: Stp1/IreP family PP2C-type Ser/Thr phosphatase [Clostridiales bacterium]|nr:Stp1/IreP family PP2C-type Ser/Thr phosphatase [Clostridiales bacterium]HBR07777.1 Stp1/IreP family PP2C-type Ser/Thr phosphatase [Clostridiales bacterium]
MNSFGITDRGKVRRENQDSFLIERIDERGCLIAVLCDGMGGERAGNIASDLAAKAFVAYVSEKLSASKAERPDIRSMMTKACNEANNMVYGYSCFDSNYTGMGTTLVAAVVEENRVFVLNVGDSRAYRISKNKLTQITKDHSLVQEMLDRGELTPEEAYRHPRKNVITRALGVDENVPSDIFVPRLLKGDLLMLCSDGLTNMLTEKDILEFAKIYRDPLSLGRVLMDEALRRGARDNVTIVIISK